MFDSLNVGLERAEEGEELNTQSAGSEIKIYSILRACSHSLVRAVSVPSYSFGNEISREWKPVVERDSKGHGSLRFSDGLLIPKARFVI
jgi:hypothetical protein